MEALFLVFILVYSESTGSSAYNENTTDISNATDLVVQQNFSELMESSTLSLPTPTYTLPTETDTSFPDQTGQSETTSENVPTDIPTTSTTQSAPTVAPREPHQLFSSLPSPEYSGTILDLCIVDTDASNCTYLLASKVDVNGVAHAVPTTWLVCRPMWTVCTSNIKANVGSVIYVPVKIYKAQANFSLLFD